MTQTPNAAPMEPAALREEFTKQLADANDKPIIFSFPNLSDNAPSKGAPIKTPSGKAASVTPNSILR